ncbi:MAG: hypothetical protein H0W68_14475 [Gemmatimonadaceae bacterium]|nr:hypothetical protein [Gemmatimonadaceae bacterium]
MTTTFFAAGAALAVDFFAALFFAAGFFAAPFFAALFFGAVDDASVALSVRAATGAGSCSAAAGEDKLAMAVAADAALPLAGPTTPKLSRLAGGAPDRPVRPRGPMPRCAGAAATTAGALLTALAAS